MIDFTSRQLRALLLVAEHRSFSRAAGALFITPSGLSVLIRELETQVGARLFDRTTRRVALTAAGEELLAVARHNLQELDGAIARIGQSATEAARSLSVGSPPLLMARVVAPAIRAFRSRRPDARFQLFDGDIFTIMRKIESGALDIGLGGVLKRLPGLRQTPLFHFSLLAIYPDRGDRSRRATTTWSALKGEKRIALPASLALQQFIDKHLARAGIVDPPVLTVNFLHTQIALVEAGEGIAIGPSYAEFECRNRRVVTKQLTDPVAYVDFSQIRQGGRKLPPIAEEFTSFLQSYIAKRAGRPEVP